MFLSYTAMMAMIFRSAPTYVKNTKQKKIDGKPIKKSKGKGKGKKK